MALDVFGNNDIFCSAYSSEFEFGMIGLWIKTEMGRLQVIPGEMVVLQLGIRFAIELPDGPSRGYAVEVFDGHFQLPDLGPIGILHVLILYFQVIAIQFVRVYRTSSLPGRRFLCATVTMVQPHSPGALLLSFRRDCFTLLLVMFLVLALLFKRELTVSFNLAMYEANCQLYLLALQKLLNSLP